MMRILIYIVFIILSGISPVFAPGKKKKNDRSLAGVEFVQESMPGEEAHSYG